MTTQIQQLKEDIAILQMKLQKLEEKEEKQKQQQTLYEICMEWCDDENNPPVSFLIGRIEQWLPKPQSAEGSQNAYVECTVEGYNDCLNQIKRKLR